MKLAKQTDNEMVFERKRSMFWFVFGLLCSGIPLILSYNRLYDIEITNLDCQRIAPGLVNCQRKQSKPFGLLPASVTSFARITKAQYFSNKYQDSDGDYSELNSVVNLVDNEGNVKNIFSESNFGNDRERMRNSAEKINNFINSNAATFAISTRQDFSWKEILWSSFGVFLYAVPGGVLIMYLSLISEAWIFDKSSGLFIHNKTLPLLGTRTFFTESLINFQELQIIEITDGDGSQNYTLKLLLKSTNRHEFLSYHYLPKVEEVAINLGDFLQIPVNKIMLDKVNETEKDLN